MKELVAAALSEDLGTGDITSESVVPEDLTVTASIVQKGEGVLYGFEVVGEVFRQTGVEFRPLVAEGEWHGDVPLDVGTVEGRARGVLAGERVALNFLAHLSGVATLTARFVRQVEGRVKVLDTRKTTPGLRALEKGAVAAGGGTNHRMGLGDAVLIKENHVALAGGIKAAVHRARRAVGERAIEVECRTVAEVEQAVAAGADRLLLDNMNPAELREAVAAAGKAAGACRPPALEASGGITLENVAEVAATGVGMVSIGALTHSAPALDLSLVVH